MHSNNDLMDPNWRPTELSEFTKYMNEKKMEYLRTHQDTFNTVHVGNWAEEYMQRIENENYRLKLQAERYRTALENIKSLGTYYCDHQGLGYECTAQAIASKALEEKSDE